MYRIKNPADTTLLFQSRFQNGNLDYAIKYSDNEYNLFLHNDINSPVAHAQCQFYFFLFFFILCF